MTLILCEPGDLSAAWAAAELQQRGVNAETLFGTMLGAATRWEHRIEEDRASVSITLADGRILSSDAPVPILNRLSFIPTGQLRATAGADYGYAVQEVYAFYLSWLTAWPGIVLNRPSPLGLAGGHRHPSEWMLLGATAGLPCIPWEQGSDDDPTLVWMPPLFETMAYVVSGEAVLPPVLPPEMAPACAALAALAETALLGIGFVRSGEAWTMNSATPIPDLSLGGAPLADALARVLGP